ncbi:NAD-P-binding protein [Obba rivulosa]|uniref:NAD-P-binding protein n=1 Tax=Obba rivulosa TaxID=1052685 RepID=A0A8E2AXQ5_9APHY|nr:NAD-P-binding protein [Obba rivulosa]
MSSRKTPIFLLGATGYIGGQVLTRLLAHPSASTFDITAIVRSPEKAQLLESKFGVKTVVGHHGELDKLEQLASQAHIVFSCADADDLPAIKAILGGLRKRHATLGDLPILIHTSGTGVLTDDARGMYATDTIYSDMNIAQIESLPPTALHRDVDLEVVGADQQGYVKTHIILPSTIYALAKGPLVEAGISNPHSIQIPRLITAAISRRQAGVVGAGKPIWPDVHIDDVADLYIVLFDAITARPDAVGHGREGFYFGENGEHTWYDISKAIGRALVELGVSESGEPTTFSREELIKYFGSETSGNYSGTNSRCRADRGRSIGWKPKYTTADMLASIEPEVEIFLKKAQSA